MEEGKKEIRIGKKTFGIVMVLVGLMILIGTLTNMDILRWALSLWPVILIVLGVETLIYSKKDNIKYDIAGGIFTFILVGIIGIFSIVNYGVNKVLYNEDIHSMIIQNRSTAEYCESFSNKLIINNAKDNSKVNIKINEIQGKEDSEVRIEIKGKNKYIFKDLEYYNYIDVQDKQNIITILDGFEEYEYINILIITPNKENVVIN